MLRMMIRITKAFIIGKIDADIAENIFRNSLTLPNNLTMRKARIKRTSQSGMSSVPKSNIDKNTITKSRMLQPFLMNLWNQLANKLSKSSKANINVKNILSLSINCPS